MIFDPVQAVSMGSIESGSDQQILLIQEMRLLAESKHFLDKMQSNDKFIRTKSRFHFANTFKGLLFVFSDFSTLIVTFKSCSEFELPIDSVIIFREAGKREDSRIEVNDIVQITFSQK